MVNFNLIHLVNVCLFVNLTIYLLAWLALGHKTEFMYNDDGMHELLSSSDVWFLSVVAFLRVECQDVFISA